MGLGVVLVEHDVGRLDRQRAAQRHGIAGVHGQVHHHLLDLPAIGFHGRQRGSKVQHYTDVFADQPFEHRTHVTDDLVHLESRGFDDLAATESEKLPRQTRRARARDLNLLNILPVRMVLALAGEQQLAVTEHDGQEVVEIVGDAAGESSNSFHLLRLVILLFERAASRDVEGNTDTAHRFAVLAEQDPAGAGEPAHRAIGPQRPILEREVGA